MTSSTSADNGAGDPLAIRPPLQRRSREAWARVLDAGVALLAEGGYEAFTIAAVCDRAQVAPRAIYARTDSKDALFLAVYEHGLARVRADQGVFADADHWRGLAPDRLVDRAVRAVAGIFARHAPLLRSVILISGAHPEVHRRGATYSAELGRLFAGVLLEVRDHLDHDDPESAVRAAYTVLFSSLVVRVAYGPAIAGSEADEDTFLASLSDMACRYLLRS
ncbi:MULTISPECIES: TetR/AcrR family transcriptional regulator [unclassified Streptomyces]|uniref:TetR/AcrR family transcriptional regulator n=1 Tax=Streptomyces sp. NBC_00119 TaxID=2975659 RepID=A0AAU1U280_9ACTN|nr:MULTISPECIES: TetR/AcrR family transcriptional regulator [unclassified Streptomyces]MCX4457503.1 TetR/AcrR family transcriptional regulator [Streptomyces sp. NBC_01719]MCX4496860.1 TetR/AcrR family transcriptional regulator [Streptomyces sp. NBC_01728]MCX4649183.1 TetR/AcrR family transcriptional regulator [Streptomyces sp. NBC_01446]MCX5322689.1 TetR/AcrR family transcriptional regulator [Streptomyces sp. NBC_00120]WSE02996.1 TetR/AcrR family transcriptional regulator [Streptomyces sp. NBC